MRTFLLFLFFIVMVGCQTTPPKRTDYTEGQWEAKVLIKDKRRSKSHVVKVDSYAVKDKSLRIDVVAAMGTPVATLVLDGEDVRYMLPQQKKFFQGTSSNKVLGPILSVPINPKLFYSLLFEVPPEGSGWSCKKADSGLLDQCENSNRGLSVVWRARNGRRKKILINHKDASLQLNVTNFKPNLDGLSNVFTFKIPKGFRRYKIVQ